MMQVLSLTARGIQLLLPVNMVAQILGRPKLVPSASAELPAVAGDLGWREFQVPVCRSSQLLGLDASADDDYERIVVLWPMKSAHSSAFIGLTSLTAPRVIDVVEDSVPEHTPEMQFALGYLLIEHELAVIPDIERLSGILYPPAN